MKSQHTARKIYHTSRYTIADELSVAEFVKAEEKGVFLFPLFVL